MGHGDGTTKTVPIEKQGSALSEDASAISAASTISVNDTDKSSFDNDNSNDNSNDTVSPWSPNCTGLKVIFLSSDTGGGHRASAESLANFFQLLYPGSEHILLDIMTDHAPAPYKDLKSWYKHLSQHPNQWNLVYKVSNTTAYQTFQQAHCRLVSEHSVRKRIQSINPDVVISVHPLMNSVPVISCRKISDKTHKHIPMFTVVTDLGSAHSSWFDKGVEKLFVASEQIRHIARTRGHVPEGKIIKTGLPIRQAFAIESDRLGTRYSKEGKEYQDEVRTDLNLEVNKKTVLVMGGGEGCGALSDIVNSLYVEFFLKGIDSQILVVCGRNEKLRKELETRDWELVLNQARIKRAHRSQHYIGSSVLNDIVCGGGSSSGAGGGGSSFTGGDGTTTSMLLSAGGCIEGGTMTSRIRRILSGSNLTLENPLTVLQSGGYYNTASETAAETDKKANNQQQQEKSATSESEVAVTGKKDEVNDENHDLDKNDSKIDEQPEISTTGTQGEPTTASSPIEEPTASKEEVVLTESDEFIPGKVTVVGLGFVTRIAEYMVAADVLVTKAGPGTIAEAAALSLPVMLTSFLPGQEEGNVDFVVSEDGKFGSYKSDKDPSGIGAEVASWLLDESKLQELSKAAKLKGAPNAAEEIVHKIGESTTRWKEINEAYAQSASSSSQTTVVGRSVSPSSSRTPSPDHIQQLEHQQQQEKENDDTKEEGASVNKFESQEDEQEEGKE